MGAQRILVVDDSRTVRRVIERTLSRAGYDVVLAADGHEGLEKAQRWVPDLVLIDFVMPRMNGVQLCQAVRAIKNLRKIPLVLMSAKVERLTERVLDQTGAVDAITKPFAPEALLAVTAHALARADTRQVGTPDGARAAASSAAFDGARTTDESDALFADVLQLSDSDLLALPASAATLIDSEASSASRAAQPYREMARRCAEVLARKVGPVLVARDGTAKSDEKLLTAIEGALDADTLSSIRSIVVDAGNDMTVRLDGSASAPSLEGRIEHCPLGEVLQLLQLQKQTGVLEVASEDHQVAICLRTGLVDMALARDADREFRLGRYLLEEGLVEREDLETLLRNRGDSRPAHLLGEQLIKLGYITSDELRGALVRQTSELVYEVMRWRAGRFRFDRLAVRAEAGSARLGLTVAALLMEGVRRVDEWHLIAEQVSSFDMILVRDEEMLSTVNVEELPREERVVLAAIDGKRQVRQIIEHTSMGSFDVCKILFQLMTSRTVREKRRRAGSGTHRAAGA